MRATLAAYGATDRRRHDARPSRGRPSSRRYGLERVAQSQELAIQGPLLKDRLPSRRSVRGTGGTQRGGDELGGGRRVGLGHEVMAPGSSQHGGHFAVSISESENGDASAQIFVQLGGHLRGLVLSQEQEEVRRRHGLCRLLA